MNYLSQIEIANRINLIRNELENRNKTGIAKLANEQGNFISTEDLQNEMYSLIYKLSKL